LLSPPLVILTVGAEPLFTRCDDLGNVLALTDDTGAVVERYEYGDFGEPQFLAPDGSALTDAGGTPVTSSPAGNPYLFHGMQWDNETGLYLDQRQGRYVDPLSGQYTTRSDSGLDQETHSRAFADNNPWTGTPVAMQKGKVKFFNESKGFGRLEGGRHTPFHNKYRAGDDPLLRKRPRRRQHYGDDPLLRKRPGRQHNGHDIILRKRPGRVKYSNITLSHRMGRNPQTGWEIKISARNGVRFKAGKALADTVK